MSAATRLQVAVDRRPDRLVRGAVVEVPGPDPVVGWQAHEVEALPGQEIEGPLVGRPAPAIVTKTIDGKPFDLSRYEGEWVLVNFFGTWCTPCRQEHPELRKFPTAHEAAGHGTAVGVDVDEDGVTVKGYIRGASGYWQRPP
mgnify:CR=1 FL=1